MNLTAELAVQVQRRRWISKKMLFSSLAECEFGLGLRLHLSYFMALLTTSPDVVTRFPSSTLLPFLLGGLLLNAES